MVDYPNGAPMASTLSCFLSSCMTLIHHSLQNSTFVGFDIAEIQPRLPDLEDYNDISDRISWVNGNLFVPLFPPLCCIKCSVSLDVFPFPDDHFDYVRVCRAGLAIPEDEVR